MINVKKIYDAESVYLCTMCDGPMNHFHIQLIPRYSFEQRALYKNVKEAEPTDKENFSSAMHGNLFWNNFGDKKVTIGKKIIAWLITILVCLCGLYPVLVFKMYGDVLGKPIGWEIIKVILMGMMSGIAIIMVWQNNLIRFLKAVEKYKHGDIKYKDEN